MASTATEIVAHYPTFVVEGLLGEVVTIAVKDTEAVASFGSGAHDDFDYGLILDFEANTSEAFWFEKGYWVKQ